MRRSQLRTPKEEPHASEPMQPMREPGQEHAAEIDGPTASAPLTYDKRETWSEGRRGELEQLLGHPITIERGLDRGVEVTDRVQVRAQRVPRRFGFDLVVTEVRVGEQARVADIALHAQTIKNIERYNGLWGNVLRIYDRVAPWRKAMAGKYPHGSRAWLVHEELSKLDSLVRLRLQEHADGAVDGHTIKDQIEFLENKIAEYQDVLESVGAFKEGQTEFRLEAPDAGDVTREALANGYRLPGAEQGVADPNAYYYKHKAGSRDEYVLARKPTAPIDAPQLRARVVGGKFMDFAFPSESRATPLSQVSHIEAAATLRKGPSFAKYAEMLERTKLASPAVIDRVISKEFASLLDGKDKDLDHLRHAVKRYFKKRVVDFLTEPSLSQEASYRRMRDTLDGLHEADRGNLVEDWYFRRERPDAKRHVPYEVNREPDGATEARREQRVADGMEGKKAIEVKDVAGQIDVEQYDAYVAKMKESEDSPIQSLEYVFTKTEGAIVNLSFFIRQMDTPELRGKLSVTVVQRNGRQVTARTKNEAELLLARLEGLK